MPNPFRKARRAGVKLRAAIDGPSGGGKSVSALRLAHCLKRAGLGTKIAVIDTENESADLYAGEVFGNDEPFEFDTMVLKQYSPSMYKACITAAEENGYDIVVIDSLSHAWIGEGGALDLVDQKGGNRFTAWKDITPMQRQMVDKMIQSKAHIIATMRTKVEYILETHTNKDGKEVSVPRKIGMAPIQREGLEYEFGIYGSMDWTNQIKITKSRCQAMNNATAIKPGDEFWMPLINWLKGGSAPIGAASQTEEVKTVFSETLQESFDRLLREIEEADTFTAAKSIGGRIKSEVEKYDDDQKAVLREKFQAKMQYLKSSAPATV